MAVAEAELRQAEMEHDNLQNTISEMRTALAFAAAGSRPVLEQAIQNATGRLRVVEKKIKDTRTELEGRAREQAEAISYQAQKETALSARERETFDGFLKMDYFTKKDFGCLEDFYAKTWDRLSESGKNEMSHRVWQGIRKNEYTFAELPDTVREKESDRAYRRLKDSAIGVGDAARIPERDRQDFIRAYEGGKRDEAEKVLNRDGFKAGMFRGAQGTAVKHERSETGRDSEGQKIGAEIAAGPTKGEPGVRTENGRGKADQAVADLNLDGFKLAETSNAPSSTDIPKNDVAPTKSGRSLGSG